MNDASIITWVFGVLGSLISGIALYRIKQLDERAKEQQARNDRVAASITALEATAVSDEHMRRVIKEEMHQMNQLIPKVMESLHQIELYVAEERGYRTARAATAARRKNDIHDLSRE